MLNTRTELPVMRPNVVDTMKFHAIDDEQFLGLIDDLEITRQTFYNTAIHFKTLRAIICNPSAYSQKLNMSNKEDAQFKSEATVKNMKELFIKEAVTVRTPSATPQTKRNQRKILNDLEENSSHSEDSSSSSSDDDDDDDADAAAIAVSNVRQTPARKLSAK